MYTEQNQPWLEVLSVDIWTTADGKRSVLELSKDEIPLFFNSENDRSPELVIPGFIPDESQLCLMRFGQGLSHEVEIEIKGVYATCKIKRLRSDTEFWCFRKIVASKIESNEELRLMLRSSVSFIINGDKSVNLTEEDRASLGHFARNAACEDDD